MAEVVKTNFPRMVDLHNYSEAHSFRDKRYNWFTLNGKPRIHKMNSSSLYV
jgi:hypothetical protein